MKRILTVDDSPTVRQHLKTTLENAGYHVTPAESGEEGAQIGEVENFDLLITDLNMPGMDGLEMLTRIRSKTVNRDTPAFVLTTQDRDSEAKARAGLVRVTAWVVKPLNPELLLRGIRLVLT